VLGLARAVSSGVALETEGFLQPSLFRLRLGLAGIVLTGGGSGMRCAVCSGIRILYKKGLARGLWR